MAALPELTENSILENLKKRYAASIIYEYVKKYHGKKTNENPPHIFAIAETAFANVRNFKENQAVIISGESGAGKTESTKVILQYLTAVTAQASGDDSKSWIEQQILEANTVLESFGNAKTVRNNNSSRFGKFVQVLLAGNQSIIGASIVNYLLEKSRVVRQAQTERNYHCFYEMAAGANKDEQAKFLLLPAAKDYYYLNQSGCIEIQGVNDKKHFEALKLAMTVLKFSPQDLDNIFKIVSSVLLVGNVNFINDDKKDCVVIQGKDLDTTKNIATLLGCDADKLVSAFCNRKITVRNESTLVPLKKDQANDNRDSISKIIYDKLFSYIVDYINNSTASKQAPANFIGVLDIFGFELFEVNSFEQLCINYTNEKLQQFFNQFIFKLEQDEYAKEGIAVDSVQYKDNQPCLDLIEAKTGIFSMLDEEGKVPKGNDDTWLQKMHDAHKKNEYYVMPKIAKGVFGVKHYAGEVMYQIVGFMDKNKDAVQDEIYELFGSAKNDIISKLFKKATGGDDKGGQKKAVTAGANFKNQLVNLVSTLSVTTPHYVRCVKPNMEKKPSIFDDTLVLGQLRYAGMLETIRIRKSGFPMRFPYDQFNYRFRFISSKATGTDQKSVATAILKNAKVDAALFRFGASKVFLKNAALDQVVDASDKIKRVMIVRIQKIWRGRKHRKKFLRVKKSATFLQKYMKAFVYRRRYKKTRKAVIKIQSVIRGWFARDYLKQLKAEKKAKEEAAKKAAEEAKRKAEEEERRLALEKASAGEREKLLAQQRAEDEERRKKQEEESKLQQYAAAAAVMNAAATSTAPAGGVGTDKLDNLFSFLDEFDQNGNKKPALTGDFADIFKIDEVGKPKVSKSKVNLFELSATPSRGPSALAAAENMVLADNSSPPPPPPPPTKAPEAPRLKFNPLAKKQAASPVPEEKIDLSFKAFAEKNFERHPKSTGGTLTFSRKQASVAKELISIDDQMAYQKTPLPTSMTKLLQLPDGPRLVESAVECFKLLLKLLDVPIKKQDEVVIAVKKIIDVGIRQPELRDEILIQSMKQSLSPPSNAPKNFAEIQLNAWQFLALCCGCFPPSKGFQKYFFNFIHTTIEDQKMKSGPAFNDVMKLATYCELTVKKLTMTGPRKFPPSVTEIQMVRTQQPVLCKFFLMDYQIKATGITAVTTAGDLVRDLASRIGLKDSVGWSIYEVLENPWEEHVIKASEYIADILAFWEFRKSTSIQASGYETVRKTPKKGEIPAQLAIGGGETKLYFKKRIFKNVNDIPVDPIEFNLIYAQAAADVSHDVYPMNEKIALQFAALKSQVDWGNFDPIQKNRYSNIHHYIPLSLVKNQTQDQWVKAIGENQAKLNGKTAVQARLLYLEGLKQFKFFGSSLFPVKYKGFWQHPENVVMGISANGVSVMLKNKTEIEHFTYKEIQNWETDSETITINVLRAQAASQAKDSQPGQEKVEAFKFESRLVDDISSLMKDYSPKVGVDKRKEREFLVTDQEMLALVKDYEKTKLNLIKKRVVKVPPGVTDVKPAALSTVFGNNAPEASSTNMAKSKDVLALSDAESLKILESWKLWMAKITSPLLATMESDVVMQAVAQSCYQSLLEIAGERNGPGQSSPQQVAQNMQISNVATINRKTIQQFQDTSVVQLAAIMQKAFMNMAVVDELYLQLAKMTTDFPQPDGKVVLQYWKVLVVLCSCVKPINPDILEYIRAHLKKSMAIDMRIHPQMQRKEEARHAKFAYKSLTRVMVSEQRKYSSGLEEISFLFRLAPISLRVYMPDGQFRAVSFDASTTAEELLKIVKEKMKLEASTGFAILEAAGGMERYLGPKEKILDWMAKREATTKSVNGPSTPIQSAASLPQAIDPKTIPRLVIKKKLFLNAQMVTSDMEEDFLLYQALSDISADKYPLTVDDALYLAGLRAQIEHGDVNASKSIDYGKIIENYVPKSLADAKTTENLAREHLSLRGKTSADCNRLFMHRIRSWPLYGSAVFEVIQSYTNDLPSACWILVNKDGVAISEKKKKAPIAFYKYAELQSISPDNNSIMIITDHSKGNIKYVFQTLMGKDIASLIHEYQDVTGQKIAGSTTTLAPK